MISQIEHHVNNQEFDQALELVPMLYQVFSDQVELVGVIAILQKNLQDHSDDALPTLEQLKQIIVG